MSGTIFVLAELVLVFAAIAGMLDLGMNGRHGDWFGTCIVICILCLIVMGLSSPR